MARRSTRSPPAAPVRVPVAAGRARPDPQQAQLLDRGDRGEELGEAVAFHQPAPGRLGGVGHAGGGRQVAVLGGGHGGLGAGGGGAEDGVGDLLQVAVADGQVAVAGVDDLALLGDLEAPGDRPWGLAAHRPAGRAAAAAEGAAAAVEQDQVDAARRRPGGQGALGPVQGQVGGEEAGVLGRVRVAEHDLEAPAPALQPGGRPRQGKVLVEHVAGPFQVGPGLEQRHHVQLQRAVGDGQAGQGPDRGQVGGGAAEADHVAAAGVGAVAGLQLGHDPQGVEHLAGRPADLRGRSRPALDGQPVEGGGVAGGAGGQLGQGLGVDGGVLADLQGGQVEAERLGLPGQVLELPVGQPGRPGRGQRRLDQAHVGQELARVPVTPAGMVPRWIGRTGRGAAEQGGAGGGQALGGQQELLEVGLVRPAGGDGGGRAREGGGVAVEGGEQLLRGRGRAGGHGQGVADPPGDSLQPRAARGRPGWPWPPWWSRR